MYHIYEDVDKFTITKQEDASPRKTSFLRLSVLRLVTDKCAKFIIINIYVSDRFGTINSCQRKFDSMTAKTLKNN